VEISDKSLILGGHHKGQLLLLHCPINYPNSLGVGLTESNYNQLKVKKED
jgi:hypothetical protein